ncbi:ABC transporter, ATP-binding protein [Deferribacter desulfuricans SSM1]|uniref:ABC transporter, ATP-binding protein n=1 Tax=Deferribacter desulfuricans (strain DSM 14783 / JCM 11476 / NBRC 101012 / SSM1) TaxID=639282 RepID=D3P9X1_DEFDS|nr:ABC transporter ATP-binding protein [Deferribacter desulfuricans]BAI81511.1 ABC transporter, ATP-binding protein [Deferribacter desulfuricans SSM1]
MQIKVIDLKKKYGNITALKNITFTIEDKTITALLGPNGAGKTTTINILTGLLKPDEGEIFYGDFSFQTNSKKIKSIIGVVPQHNNIDRDLTVYQNLLVHAILFGLKKNEIKNRIEEILHFTGLINHKNKKAGKLSGGMKRRLVIGRAILHRPKILFLDEPTVGLDPATRRHIWDFVKNINKNFGCTVVLTTHYIEEAELLSDYVYFIDKGEIIKYGEPEKLKSEMGKYVLEIFSGGKTIEEYFESKTEAIERLKQHEDVDLAKIRDVNLEDVYLKLTGRKIDI